MRVEPFCHRVAIMCFGQPKGVQFVVECGFAESQQPDCLVLVAAFQTDYDPYRNPWLA